MIEYIEGAGPSAKHGLIFGPDGWGWYDPGPASDDTIVVSDLRLCYSMAVKAALIGRKVLHAPRVTMADPVDLGPFKTAAEQARAICNVLMTAPSDMAYRTFMSRRAAAETVAEWATARDFNRTMAELVLISCERTGFLWKGDIVRPRFSFKETKTGRFSTESGSFPCMAIKASDRHQLTARPGKSLVVYDFNAIDGRSVVSLHPDARKRFGDVSGDLYAGIFRELFGKDPDPDERSALKLSFLRYCYRTSMSKVPPELDDLFARELPWIEALRKSHHDEELHDHEGHGLALAAQTASSAAFCGALSAIVPYACGSDSFMRPLFTVHDELVTEVDDGRLETAGIIAGLLEDGAYDASGVRHVVKWKVGKDYAQCK